MEQTLKPALRFKGFTDTWEQRKLSELAQITMGQSPNGMNYTSNPEDYILVQGNADMVNGWVTPRVWTTQITKMAEPYDLIFSVRAPVGEVGKTMYKAVIGRGVASVRGNEFVFQELLRLKMNNHWKTISTGSTFDSINSTELRATSIKAPKIEEQNKIGGFLKSIDTLITLHQRKYDKLVNVKKALLDKMFPKNGELTPKLRFKGFTDTWEQCELDSLSDRFDNLRIPIAEANRVTGNTPYYGANGIQGYVKGHTHQGEFILVAEDGANDLKNYPVQYVNGDIWVNNHAHVLQAKNKIADTRYLGYAISQTNIEPYLVGGGRAKLNAATMMKIMVSAPKKISEQKAIGELFSNLDSLITLHQSKYEKLVNIKKSLLQKMFV